MASLIADLTAPHPNAVVNAVGNVTAAIAQAAQVTLIVTSKKQIDPIALMAGSLFVSGLVRKAVFVGNDYLVRPIARRFNCQTQQAKIA